MDIRCPSCSKLFRVADEKIAGKGIRFKCSKCAEVITITKDDFEMDLLAREAEGEAPAPQAAAPAAPKPAAPAPPAPPAEPEAREYKPPVDQPSDEEAAPDQQLPAASLGDFDFSEPHAAATAAAHPAEGFGGDFSFGAAAEEGQEQAAPEIELTPEAAAEAEAALNFPADLISEPKRKVAFSAPADEEPAMPAGDASPQAGAETAAAEEELDLGAALAMPKEPVAGPEAAAEKESEPAVAPAQPAGPVFTPELLAQMKRAAPAKAAPAAEEEMDLGAALSIPRGESSGDQKKVPSASKAVDSDGSGIGRRVALFGGVAFVIVVVAAAALYFLGMLPGVSDTTPSEKSAAQKQPQTRKEGITPAGLLLENATAYFAPGTGDLVLAGTVKNVSDAAKRGWYLEADIIDAAQKTLATVRVLNGTALLGKREQDLLVKRGEKAEKLAAAAAQAGKTSVITAGGSVPFEVRFPGPPAGSARVVPALKAADPEALLKQHGAAK